VVLVFFATGAGAAGCSCTSSRSSRRWKIAELFIGVIVAPEGSTLAYTDSYARQLEQFYKPFPRWFHVLLLRRARAGKTQSGQQRLSFVRLKPLGRAPAQTTGDRQGTGAEDVRRFARRAGVPDQSALFGAKLPQSGGAVRDPGQQLRAELQKLVDQR
jgi:multidrug efflux pump